MNNENEQFSLENLSPKKVELIDLAVKYSSLNIEGIDDVVGYKLVDTARKDLKAKRREIERFVEAYLKNMREAYNSKRQEVLDLQEDHISIISKTEDALEEKQNRIDVEKERNARAVVLPERKEKLKMIEIEMPDEDILDMSSEEFTEFYNNKKAGFLEEKERRLKEEEERINREKELEEAKKKARKEAEEEAKQEAERKEREAKEREEVIKKEAEAEKKRAVEEAERKAEADRQKIIAEQKEKDRKIKEEEDRKEADKRRLEKEEIEKQAKLEKEKKYQNFLADNGYSEEAKADYHIIRQGNAIVLYKKLATLEL